MSLMYGAQSDRATVHLYCSWNFPKLEVRRVLLVAPAYLARSCVSMFTNETHKPKR